MTITTAMAISFKREILQAKHCLNANLTVTGNTTNTGTTINNMSSVTDIVRGMTVTGTGIAANTYVENIVDSGSLTISKAATADGTDVDLTFGGDLLKVALIKESPNGTYGGASTNYANIVNAADEVTGEGYTAGGTNLTNVTPAIDGYSAVATFTPDPSWTDATFIAQGCMVYNSSLRCVDSGRAISVHDFVTPQSVNAGTFTLIMPVADAYNAILRIG